MSTPINDGGPAFPVPAELCQDLTIHQQRGMTLRDWFAGKALAAMPAEYMVEQPDHVIAYSAYSLADAMLQARRDKQ
jgi:hypothetical protein